ncbi:MAG: hypothetical protein KDK12_18255 [Rhodobacteraceae bacterium]|nr:hypothetical protein [Paracoccaceae bacterium]
MKQAIVILHGMGEQVPMATLNAFVRAVWTTDLDLNDADRPATGTEGRRVANASWARPDPRNSSTELRRITTESDKSGNKTDFYEYYWAHMIEGTTWEHVATWIRDLLFRNPCRRVPRRVLHAWIVLWLITLVVAGATLWGLLPGPEEPRPGLVVLSALGGMAVSAFVSSVLIKRFGDVARYVKALPPNVARRHEIRQTGVDLLDRLIDSGEYARIVVVAHSLGTIVGYDILAMLFARRNTVSNKGAARDMPQPHRDALEEAIRAALAGTLPLDVATFQDMQAAALAEARDQGLKWPITDFVTLGAPLTHAEFLMAESRKDLRERQRQRLLPTCPPTMEYDDTTRLRHFTYSRLAGRQPLDRRRPHHAALFAYTRWTNLYSDERCLLTGDLISGPVAEAFGLEGAESVVRGARDIGVLPALTATGRKAEGHRRVFFSHNDYWDMDKGSDTGAPEVPHHIAELRKAVAILQEKG